MSIIDPIYVGHDTLNKLLAYCRSSQLDQLSLIADENTYQALGSRVEAALKEANCDVTVIILKGEEVVANSQYVLDVLVQMPVEQHTLIAVGSGTITDITRFVSHRTQNRFISMPTAPSVDGFTSLGAPLVLHGVKQTWTSHAPEAIFADLPTLQAAPSELIAAGFGDILGKATSLADWQLGWILHDEPFDELIMERTRYALDQCLNNVDRIAAGEEMGIWFLMDSLCESGLCIVDFGQSHPASGSEHHCSHYWEMMLLQENRPAILHGAKVGFAAVEMARLYATLRAMSREEMNVILEGAEKPERDAQVQAIREGFGAVAQLVIDTHGNFLDMTDAQFEDIKRRLLNNWEVVQGIAESVPAPEELVEVLETVGGSVTGRALGLSDDDVQRAFQYGHYLRNRLTIRKLFHLLGMGVANFTDRASDEPSGKG